MHKIQTVARGVILLAIFCLFLGRMLAQNTDFEQVCQIPEDQMVTVSGIICKKEFKGEDGLYYIKNARITQQKKGSDNIESDLPENVTDGNVVVLNRVILRVASTEYRIGEEITVRCKMRWMEEASNRGGFDERQYYHSLGISTFLYCDSLPQVIEQKRKCPIRNGLCTLREQMRAVYVKELNEKDAGILSSMVLGDKSLMEDELKQLYNSAGISHILAVSGLHVSIIGLTLFEFLRKRRQKYVTCCLVSGVILLLFCVMSGMSVSAMRAGIMFLIFLGAQFLGRKYHSLRALLVAAVITLIVNPSYIYNAGFLFSYFAVFGAVAVAPVLVEGWKPKEEKQKSIKFQKIDEKTEKILAKIKKSMLGVGNSAILSGSILLTTLPLNAYYFFEVPLYGLLANLVVIPLAGTVMGFGLLGGLLGSVLHVFPGNTIFTIVDGFTWLAFIPCHWILRLYEGICQGLKWLPADVWITGRPPLWMLAVYYGVLVCFVWWFQYKDCILRKRKVGRKNIEKEIFRNKTLRMFLDMILKMVINRKMIVVFTLAYMIFIFTLSPAKQFQISFLDVGQGDGIYINGGDGKQYFVDGGSTSEKELGRYTILPYLKYHRVREIDVWFVTHADADHISGLLEVLDKGYAIKTIAISALAPEDENLLELKAVAREHGTEIVFVENEDYVPGKDYRIVCYTPETEDTQDRNQFSLVNLIEFKDCNILLTGDIGQFQEEWLLKQPGIGDVDILKAAHHGSKYSNSEVFLETIRPELTVISCGENNLYGHPHQEVLERLETVGSKILMTMEEGEITILP